MDARSNFARNTPIKVFSEKVKRQESEYDIQLELVIELASNTHIYM